MKSILIVYGSLTGTTMEVATTLHEKISAALPELSFELQNIRDVSPSAMQQYDQVVFGTSTWDHGIPCPDVEVFLEDLVTEKPDYSSLNFALFGVGDSAYSEFCGALPLVQADLEQCSGHIYPEQFTIDGYPNDTVMNQLVGWTKQFVTATASAQPTETVEQTN